jgi:hypothetical protein
VGGARVAALPPDDCPELVHGRHDGAAWTGIFPDGMPLQTWRAMAPSTGGSERRRPSSIIPVPRRSPRWAGRRDGRFRKCGPSCG